MNKKLLFLSATFLSLMSFSQTNVVNDGGLEEWSDSATLDNWTIENTVIQNTVDFAEGTSSASLEIFERGVNPSLFTLVPMVSGVEYRISYKFKYVDSNYGGTHPVSFRMSRQGSAVTLSRSSFASDNEWVEKTDTFTPDVTGDYDLTLSIATFDDEFFEVLFDDIRIETDEVLSVSGVSDVAKIKVFPSTSEDIIYIENLDLNDEYIITVFDLSGVKQSIEVESDSIDVSSLTAGIYFLNFKSGTTNVTKKIIKK